MAVTEVTKIIELDKPDSKHINEQNFQNIKVLLDTENDNKINEQEQINSENISTRNNSKC